MVTYKVGERVHLSKKGREHHERILAYDGDWTVHDIMGPSFAGGKTYYWIKGPTDMLGSMSEEDLELATPATGIEIPPGKALYITGRKILENLDEHSMWVGVGDHRKNDYEVR